MSTLWGIDLGGTKIEGIVLDKITGSVLSRTRVPTEGHLGYEHVLNQIRLLISFLEKESATKTDKIGICTPGTMDPVLQVMKNCNSTSLNGKNLKKDLEDYLQKSFVTSNDANCFALAETKMGIIPDKSPDAEVVFGIILGTGVGGGIVVNGKVINGKHGIGGEWGHNHLDDSGGPCYCGRKGCVETILSGPAIQKYYKKISNQDLIVKDILSLYHQHDAAAVETMDRFF
jgi:fructokinase